MIYALFKFLDVSRVDVFAIYFYWRIFTKFKVKVEAQFLPLFDKISTIYKNWHNY